MSLVTANDKAVQKVHKCAEFRENSVINLGMQKRV